MKFPNKISLAHLPTPIEKLESVSKRLNQNIYIKRDDFTGIEVSGNKVRKLEYSVKEALDLGAKTLITCGAVQSNHARATVAVAKKLGLNIHLVLSGDPNQLSVGNLFIDTLMDATITWIPPDDFKDSHQSVMASLKQTYDLEDELAYIIPIGASNGIGNFGYYNCFNEILNQEKELGIVFDTIVCTVGSGATYGGLYLGNQLNRSAKEIIGFTISAPSDYFVQEITKILKESYAIMQMEEPLDPSDMKIIDGFQGLGYAISKQDEIDFIKYIARTEGLLLDPVYTGKAFKGLFESIQNGLFPDSKNILFIHTGGIFGLLSKCEVF